MAVNRSISLAIIAAVAVGAMLYLVLLFESLPYIGPLFMVAAVTVTAFAIFDGLGQILLPPVKILAERLSRDSRLAAIIAE
jgi:hypothetical protein